MQTEKLNSTGYIDEVYKAFCFFFCYFPLLYCFTVVCHLKPCPQCRTFLRQCGQAFTVNKVVHKWKAVRVYDPVTFYMLATNNK